MEKNLIFLFSLPRSGSTLIQRILGSHDQIATTTEPWFLLQFLYLLKSNGVFSEFSHDNLYKAFSDYLKVLPAGKVDYYQCLEQFCFSLYEKAKNKDSLYFLDKTPRYYLIIPEIANVFPNAKFIFLFRNPLQIFSSTIRTWCKNSLKIHRRYIDLYIGPQLLTDGYETIKNKSISICYENFILRPDESLRQIFEYLGLDYDSNILTKFVDTKLHGRMGDKLGYNEFSLLNISTINKWKSTFNSKYRIKIAKKYLAEIGPEPIKIMGYDIKNLVDELSQIQTNRIGLFPDYVHWQLVLIYRYLELPIMKKKFINSFLLNKKAIIHS